MEINKVGILVVFTGRYIDFFPDFYNTMELNFLPNKPKTYFCFTDTTKKIEYNNVVIIHKKYEGFPKDTLYRYKMFANASEQIFEKNVDVLYYLDVDMKIVGHVGEEILPKLEKPLVCVQHPGYFRKNQFSFPYDKNKKCNAYVQLIKKVNPGYMAGGVQGGLTSFYIKTARIINKMIDEDVQAGILAIWHDESHWNKFVYTYSEMFTVMNPTYCFPETVNGKQYKNIIGLPRKIIALDKDHQYYRNITHKKR
jgi:hypothetical protein